MNRYRSRNRAKGKIIFYFLFFNGLVSRKTVFFLKENPPPSFFVSIKRQSSGDTNNSMILYGYFCLLSQTALKDEGR
jgi:hypothetical protein